jgi:flagellar biosynthesis/type III secretory pathway M-ring protein FliF/YscJ
MTQKPEVTTSSKNPLSGVYQSPLQKLFTRQQPKVKAKKGMARLLLVYAENDPKRIAQLLKLWIDKSNLSSD